MAATAEAALAAWRHHGLDGSVAVGRSVLPASLAVEIIPLELLVHGWDIAHATGQDIDVSPEVASYVLDRARELITRTSAVVASPPRCLPDRRPRSCSG